MKRYAILALATCALSACTDPDNARRVLEDNGYTEVQTGGYAAFSCDAKSDTYATAFAAKSPNGRLVSGAVCKGLLKGSTIRLN